MGDGNSCYFQSRGRAGPISANMTNVGDCRDVHGASKEYLGVGGFAGIDPPRPKEEPCLGMSFCHWKLRSRGRSGRGRVMGPDGGGREGGTSNAKMVTCVISGRGQYTSRVPLVRQYG